MIRAVRDYILINLEYAEKERGIYIPDQAKQYHGGFWGKVVDVGLDSPLKNELAPGDKIVFLRHEGFKVYDGDKEYLAVKSRWVYGKAVEK